MFVAGSFAADKVVSLRESEEANIVTVEAILAPGVRRVSRNINDAEGSAPLQKSS